MTPWTSCSYVLLLEWLRPGCLTPLFEDLVRETWEKVNVSFNENGTVSFHQRKVFHFDPEHSKGDVDDMVVIPNIPMLSATSQSKHAARFLRLAMASIMDILKIKPFVEVSVHQLLWGYEDPLLKLAKDVVPKDQKLPYDEFGLMYGWGIDHVFWLAHGYPGELGTYHHGSLGYVRARWGQCSAFFGHFNKRGKRFLPRFSVAMQAIGSQPFTEYSDITRERKLVRWVGERSRDERGCQKEPSYLGGCGSCSSISDNIAVSLEDVCHFPPTGPPTLTPTRVWPEERLGGQVHHVVSCERIYDDELDLANYNPPQWLFCKWTRNPCKWKESES
uniref:Scavenger receptor class B member 1 n=1 Tax=Timema tahoe TaxID=61484 RepID=A0A7R9ISN5_9NEOP|nr:unnamed protein product [Timema tahoe]